MCYCTVIVVQSEHVTHQNDARCAVCKERRDDFYFELYGLIPAIRDNLLCCYIMKMIINESRKLDPSKEKKKRRKSSTKV